MAAGVVDWAELGNDDAIPADKLANGADGAEPAGADRPQPRACRDFARGRYALRPDDDGSRGTRYQSRTSLRFIVNVAEAGRYSMDALVSATVQGNLFLFRDSDIRFDFAFDSQFEAAGAADFHRDVPHDGATGQYHWNADDIELEAATNYILTVTVAIVGPQSTIRNGALRYGVDAPTTLSM